MTLIEIAMQALEEIADSEGDHVEFTGCQASSVAHEALAEIRRQQYLGGGW